ncbi:MAG: GGDEF domain-containing protein [Leptospiraceae bacterium]|nr:GGDEF domain-containing protein [Leptospiraceae bacterium]
MRRLLARIPFRILFPIILASFTLVSVLIMIRTQTENVKSTLIQDRRFLVAQTMELARSHLVDRLRAGLPLKDDYLRLLNRDHEILFFVVSDAGDRIIQSNSEGLVGKTILEAIQKAPSLDRERRRSLEEFFRKWKASDGQPAVEYQKNRKDILAIYQYESSRGSGIIMQLYPLGRLIRERQSAVTDNVLSTNLAIAGVLAALALAYYLFLMRRLKELLSTTAAFGRGNLDLRANVDGRDEIASLGQTFNMMADRIRNLAYRDAVTGIPNRLAFETTANRVLMHRNTRAALVYLDLDGFKDINDSLGHSTGDTMLDEVAHRLENTLKQMAGEESILARIGGDEFAILLPGRQDRKNIEGFCETLLQEISRDYHVLGNVLHVTASIGLALFPENGSDFEELLKNADAAMYSGKRAGKNTYIFFDQEIQARNSRKVHLASALRKAIDRQELDLHFQPIVDLGTGRITHGEALLRWSNEEFGHVRPSEFIPILEESGYIRDVGQWVLERSCEIAVRWREKGYSQTGVSVNVAVQQLSQKDFAARVGEVLRQTGLPAGSLILEITESELMRRPATTLRMLEELESMGVELAVDDFGTGYSSLNYLKYFPVHYLKLDSSFVKSLDTDADNAAISRAIIGLAHALKLKMVAEGVESRTIAEFLHQESCNLIQGYFTGAPLSEEGFLRALSNQGPLFTDAIS